MTPVKKAQSESNQGPSAYQPSALPLGHTGSQEEREGNMGLYVHRNH